MEVVNLSEFDFMGIFTLKDVEGIEDLVTKVEDNCYLSRNYDSYYKQDTYSEQSEKRENLKTRLTGNLDKKNFIILENILNASGKVFFNEFQRKVTSPQEENHMEEAKKCLEDDVRNIINFFKRKTYSTIK